MLRLPGRPPAVRVTSTTTRPATGQWVETTDVPAPDCETYEVRGGVLFRVLTTSPAPEVERKYLVGREAAAYLGMTYGSFRNIAKFIRKSKHGRYTREALDRYAK